MLHAENSATGPSTATMQPPRSETAFAVSTDSIAYNATYADMPGEDICAPLQPPEWPAANSLAPTNRAPAQTNNKRSMPTVPPSPMEAPALFATGLPYHTVATPRHAGQVPYAPYHQQASSSSYRRVTPHANIADPLQQKRLPFTARVRMNTTAGASSHARSRPTSPALGQRPLPAPVGTSTLIAPVAAVGQRQFGHTAVVSSIDWTVESAPSRRSVSTTPPRALSPAPSAQHAYNHSVSVTEGNETTGGCPSRTSLANSIRIPNNDGSSPARIPADDNQADVSCHLFGWVRAITCRSR
ncbi:hypothetical protein THASP1DRAFT_29620 [Thamnocephalis sphaerospora]|uniref:Uncharacterized protein n=1 Tax=Thamnocephalis sphaerospora TaxID=78915 RepID=A0A4P9XRK0_9FUNG|nr:hypothetical protein THASP1DRAFT_29620 [Thamnocephalis sphaerospora]|eukprot:RKP08572.1 hypothetical protein THASP1DRAFT_29620 [Thamnocephalis sphaerospora]